MEPVISEMYVYLGIDSSTSDPDEITRLIGVKPTQVHRKGDPIGKTKLRCRTNSWEYRVSATTSFDLQKLVKKLLDKFKDKGKLKKGISKGKGTIVCVLFASDTNQSLELSPEVMKEISALNCGLWFDFYPVPPVEPR